MYKKWEKVLDKFLSVWKSKKNVTGAVVYGSFVFGVPDRFSDIDVYIVLDKNTKRRSRGTVRIDGFLIEYFATSFDYVLDKMEDDFRNRDIELIKAFCFGRVLFENDKTVDYIRRKAEKYLRRKIKISKEEVEISKYELWNMQNSLEKVFCTDKYEFDFVFYNGLYRVFDIYAKYLGYFSVPYHKFFRIYTGKVRLSDKAQKIPDLYFIDIFKKVVKARNKTDKIKLYKKITKYVLEKMGGFEIDNWNIDI